MYLCQNVIFMHDKDLFQFPFLYGVTWIYDIKGKIPFSGPVIERAYRGVELL